MVFRMVMICGGLLAGVLLAATPAMAEKKVDKDAAHMGIVVSAENGMLTMTDKDGKNEHSHAVSAEAKISCDGKECKLEDLEKGCHVKVTIAEKDGKKWAVKIEAKKEKK